MINFKAITSTILAAALCATLSVSAAAEQPSMIEQLEDTEGFDTLSLMQAEYENLVSDRISGSAANSYGSDPAAISDMQIIEEICKVHIATSRAYVRDPGSYSTTTFFSPEAGENQLVKNHVSQYKYLNALYKANGWTFYSDSLSFSGFKAEIDGDNAHASIVEEYSYDIDNGFDNLSWLSREYSIDLRKSSGNWYITCISTDSPIESEEIDVEAQIALLNQPVESTGLPDDPDMECDIAPASSNLYSWIYNASDAIDYAATYYDGWNPLFSYNITEDGEVDCQNFVSQCIWAGLGGTSETDIPCVSTALVGDNAPNVWCNCQYSTYYSDDYRLNWAWDNVIGFFRLIEVCSPNTIGPYGIVYTSNAIAYAKAGEPLYCDNNGGSANGESIDHAMFITKVNGTSGSRTVNNIFIAAHSDPTETAYQALSEYCGNLTSKSFARIHITGGYYPSKQP